MLCSKVSEFFDSVVRSTVKFHNLIGLKDLKLPSLRAFMDAIVAVDLTMPNYAQHIIMVIL